MKIIQLVQKPQLRGAEIFASQLSNHLSKLGHEVLMVTIFVGDADLPFEGETIHLERPLSKRFFDLKGWRKFNKIVDDFGPDVVQANASDTLKFAASSKLFFSWKAPLVYRNANKMGDFINSKIKWHLNKFYLSQVSYVISVSRECEKDFKETFHYPDSQIETVEIGVEDQDLGSVPEDLRTIFEKGPVLAHIGGFVPEKNHKGLINIFKGTLEKHPETQLLLLGKGKLQEETRELVRAFELEGHVHFLNYRKDVLEILKHSRAFVLPSLIEGLPAVILEAMYCNTPVIAYNVGGIGEVVMPNKTGWLITKGRENEFEEAVVNVLAGGPEVEKLVKNAKDLISKKFLNDQIARRFYGAYEATLKRP